MIRYTPPKARVWGHQVGRLSAAVLVERSLRFLDERCAIEPVPPSELTIAWYPAEHPSVSALASEINDILGAATNVNEMPDAQGQTFRQLRWPFAVERLPTTAAWFDQLSEASDTARVVAHASVFWTFAWRDGLPPSPPASEPPGGMFGLHLGRPHRVSTMFTFPDLAGYLATKTYLAGIGLVELSDKHVRPKLAGAPASKGGR